MIVGGEATSDLKHFEEIFPEFRDELRSTVVDDTIGRPCFRNTSHITTLTVSSLVIAFVQGMKCVILVYRSTIVKIALNPFETGRSVIKSREVDYHGLIGNGNGSNKPYG